MPARRLALLIAVLTGVFVLGVALAVAGLLALGDPGLVVVCLVAALAGLAAAALAGFAARAAADDDEEEGQADGLSTSLRMPQPPPQRPVRVQSLPVADLPEAYVAAVMKGLQASRRASRAGDQR